MAFADDDDEQEQGDNDYASDISFTKFKYSLQNLLTTVKVLWDKRMSLQQELDMAMKKHKKLELEHCEKYSALQSEVAVGSEVRRLLENTVMHLKREIYSKDSQIQSLKEEMKLVVDARNELMENLKASNYELECRIQEKTSDLAILKEKHNRHSLLLDAVEREAFTVRQAVDETTLHIKHKEEEVHALHLKLDKVLGFKTSFLDKINYLEKQFEDASRSVHARDENIKNLVTKLEMAHDDHGLKTQLTFYQQAIEIKENIISKLGLEKEALLADLKSSELVMESLQKTIIQQDQTIEGFQEKVLVLQKDIDIMQDTISKNENELSLFMKGNKNLLEFLQDQKDSFAAPIQLWADKKVTLEAQICELESRIVDIESMNVNKRAVDKETSTDDLCDNSIMILHSNTKQSSSKLSVESTLKTSNIREDEMEGMAPENLCDHEADLSVNTVMILYGANASMVDKSASQTYKDLENSITMCDPHFKDNRNKYNGNNFQAVPLAHNAEYEIQEYESNNKGSEFVLEASHFITSFTTSNEGQESQSAERQFYNCAKKEELKGIDYLEQDKTSVIRIPGIDISHIEIQESNTIAKLNIMEKVHKCSTKDFCGPENQIWGGRTVTATFEIKKIHPFNITSIMKRLGRPLTLINMKKKPCTAKQTELIVINPRKLLRQTRKPKVAKIMEIAEDISMRSKTVTESYYDDSIESSHEAVSVLEMSTCPGDVGASPNKNFISNSTDHTAADALDPPQEFKGKQYPKEDFLPCNLNTGTKSDHTVCKYEKSDTSSAQTNGKTVAARKFQLSSPLSHQNTMVQSAANRKWVSHSTSGDECICNVPAYGYMVNCKTCGSCFHTACISFSICKPGDSYVCVNCQELPCRKRRQVDN